jgi:hypothetical protein
MRLIVLTGEGNGDAFVAVVGLLAGSALAHALGITAAPAGGPPDAGKIAVTVSLVATLAYAVAMRRPHAGSL